MAKDTKQFPSELKKSDDGTITITVTIAASQVKKTRDEVVQETAKKAKVAGFREGKAPRKIVEEQIDEAKVREEVLKKLLPIAYTEAIQTHNLRPIINPKIHVDKLEDGKDWVFSATMCELPNINLGNYKDAVKKVTAKSKIVIPGKEQQAAKFDDIMKAVLESAKVTVPQVLIDQEVERLLSQTLDEIKRLGLTLDQYLLSTKKTPETLRDEFAQKARSDIALEFVLQQIAESEKITVDQHEVDEAVQKAKDPHEKEHLEQNRYLLASILRQQKTLDFLKNL